MAEKDLGKTEELFAFLQGETPAGCRIADADVPHLTDAQAWTVIHHLGNLHWQVPDFIERCGVCGDLYDSEREGVCLDFGGPPFHFCEAYCCEAKAAVKRALCPEE